MGEHEQARIAQAMRDLIAAARAVNSDVPLNSPPAEEAVVRALGALSSNDACQELMAMWAQCDGGVIGGLQFMSTEECYQYTRDLIAIQNWGNGDFDCFVTQGDLKGTICFTNHQSNMRSTVGSSLVVWLESLRAELETVGCIRHPKDYANQQDQAGTYSRVIADLAPFNCELTRWVERTQA